MSEWITIDDYPCCSICGGYRGRYDEPTHKIEDCLEVLANKVRKLQERLDSMEESTR